MEDQSSGHYQWTEKYLDVMDDVEYRRVESVEDVEEIGQFRARSYKQSKMMDPEGPIVDDIDFHSHARIFAIYHREHLVSTIRLHHVVSQERYGTSYDVFPDMLDPLLDQGLTFIDSVRHASDPDLTSELPMPFLTLRLAVMATHYFGADYALASVRREHFAFYRRAFGATQLTVARQHKDYGIPLGLFATGREAMYERIIERFPFWKSHPRERELLFAPASELGVTPLTIRPTARLMIERARASAAAA